MTNRQSLLTGLVLTLSLWFFSSTGVSQLVEITRRIGIVSLQPCNGLPVVTYQPGERCGNKNGTCPAYNHAVEGGGCGTSTTVAGRTMQSHDRKCGNGSSTGPYFSLCKEDTSHTFTCTYRFTCGRGTIPNPAHDPDDLNSPVVLDICTPKTRHESVGSGHPGRSFVCDSGVN